MDGLTIRSLWNWKSHRRALWQGTKFISIAAILTSIVVGATAALDHLLTTASDERASRMCDQQVSMLLNAHGTVDLQRAQYLIQDLNCDVQRRLPSK